MTNIIYKEESYKIIGACMKVHNNLGAGFLEAVYQEALQDELLRQEIPFKRQVKLNIHYNGKLLKKYYKADFVCYDKIIVEIKSSQFLHKDQIKVSWVNGVGNPGDVTSFIPPMQGFFVKTAANATINITSSAKTHTTHARYKGETIIPLVRLKIEDDNGKDETVVRFDNNATSSFDNNFDALKIMPDKNRVNIWSTLENYNFSINGVPFPDTTIEIPLTIIIPADGNFKITTFQIDGLEDYGLTLKDLDQDFSIDLNEINEYSFTADSGTVTDRFVLTISNLASGLPDITEPEPEKAFNIYSSREILYISPVKDNWNGRRGELRIYYITGKIVKQQKNIEWYKGETKEIPFNITHGIYLIEITSPLHRYVGKVSVVR